MATVTTTREASATLRRVLDEELAFSPSFLVHFSSHLAMALVALEQLGAPAPVLEATLAAHRDDPSTERRDDVDVLAERRREVARDGITATVRRRVPALVEAPGAALFHPVIRLAYALDVGHEGQVAAALLDWERRAGSSAGTVLTPGDRRLPDVASSLAAHPAGTWPTTFDLGGLGRRPELTAALQGVALDEHTMDDVSEFALAAHVAADHFLTLHLVTGARAVRAVASVLDDATALRLAAATFPVMALGYAAVGAPPLLGPSALDARRRASLPSVEQIAERAIADHDPHVIKLANVALVEEERTADPLYRYVAARVVGLAPPIA